MGTFALTEFFGRSWKLYCLDIHLDLCKDRKEDEWRETVVNFEIKIGETKARRLIE